MKFSEYLLLLESEFSLNTKEDIATAIEKFDDLPEGKKPSEAKRILKAAEDVGYIVKKEEILKYQVENQKELKKETPTEEIPIEPGKEKPTEQKVEKKLVKDTEFFKKYKHLNLDRYPDPEIDPNTVEEYPDNIGKGAILKWRHPKNNKWIYSYDEKFLTENSNYKWDRVKDVKNEDLENIDNKTLELLKEEEEDKKDSGAIIRIILKTGLRIGDKTLKTGTDNRGISSLKPESATIDDEGNISLDFVGKSYKQNLTTFNDPDLAEYLKEKISKNKDKDFLFDVSNDTAETNFKKIAKKGMLIKDLRTLKAMNLSRNFLSDDAIPPIPLAGSPSEIKKQIMNKLKMNFEIVSKQLNNTPAIAQANYVMPSIVDEWLRKLGVKEVNLSDTKYSQYNLNESKYSPETINNFDECDTYPLPKWWKDQNIILVDANVETDKENRE